MNIAEITARFPTLGSQKKDNSDQLQNTQDWRLKRLGRVTGSRFKDVQFIEVKNSGTSKDSMFCWIWSRPEKERIEAIEKVGLKVEKKPTNDQLKKVIAELPGDIILAKGAKTLMNRLIWECSLDFSDMKKVLRRLKEQESFGSSRSTRRGHELEPEARKVYSEMLGVEILQVGFHSFDGHDILGVSSDGYFEEDGLTGIIEIKCPWAGENHSKMWAAGYDDRYIDQMLGGIIAHNADFCDFVSYDPDLREKKVIHSFRLWRKDFKTEIEDLKNRLDLFCKLYRVELEKYGLTLPNIKT